MRSDVKTKFFLCFVGAAAIAWFVPRFPVQTAQANDRVATDVVARMRPLGLNVVGQPERQGGVYVVNALDPRGTELRVILDASTGSVVSIGPSPVVTATYAYSPYYDASPRIITIAPVDDDDYLAPRSRGRDTGERRAPQKAVRQVVPSRERPRDVQVSIEPPRTAVDTAEHERARYEELKREEIRRSVERERRAALAPVKVAPVTPAAPSTVVPPPVAAPQPAPKIRPRTVLAPPPYADPGPSPIKPLQHPDAKRFAPADEQTAPAEAPAAPVEDPSRSELQAAVPQALPQIPAPPRAVAASTQPQLEMKAESKPAEDRSSEAKFSETKPAETKPNSPEDAPPPGDPVGDFATPQR